MHKTRLLIWAIVVIAFVTTFNYGGCGGGGSDSGSSGIPLSTPSVTTNPATNITLTTATLNGTINSKGLGTTNYYFQWGLTTSYGSTTTYQNFNSGTSANVSANITGLLPNTNYNFRIRATIGSNTYNGADQTFNTGLPPTCATNPATNITINSATLNGTVNPNGASTTAYFDYGLTTSYGITTTSQTIGSGTTGLAVSATVSSLTSNAGYNFRMVGTNSSGRIYGDNLTFTTLAPLPICTTQGATNITANSATLNGIVNPNSLNVTSCWFDYGASLSYGISATVVSLPGSGTNPISVTANVLSLLSSTQYNFRVVATNSNGTTNGNNRTFTTGAPIGSAPTCTTDPADNSATNSARLNGTVNPNGVPTTAYFNYGLATSYGNSTTSQSIGSGITSLAVLDSVSSLTSNTRYNFRVVAINSGGTTNGNNLTFTTLAPPSSTTNDATNITFNSAALNGTVNPNGLDVTSCYFDYGTSQSYGNTATVSPLPGSGTSPVSVTANASSLSASTQYNFRVVATNAGGTTNGNNLTFTTTALPPPTCTTNAATNPTNNSAALNGTVNPNGLDVTSCYFDYGTSQSYGSTASVSPLPGSGTTPVSVTANASSLSASTQYNFRVVATNAGGTTNGLNQTFTTTAIPPPTCTTDAADNFTTNAARLNGTVNPNGVDTNAYFQWGLTTSYGNTTTSQAIGSGTTNVAVTADISGLSTSTLYNFRVVATNAGGTTNGLNQTFTTTALPPPTCTYPTISATNVTNNSATLNGIVNPNGLDVTSCYFDYGTSQSYGNTATVSPLPGSGTSNVSVSANISSLLATTLYNFRVVATNAGGTTNGLNQTFTTTALLPPAQVGSPNPANNATGVSTTTALSWAPASGATSYNVYFGTNNPPSNIINGTNTVSISYALSSLLYATIYYWRIDSVNANGTTTGIVWSFTTAAAGGGGGTAVDDYVWVANSGSANVTRITKSDLSTTTIAVGTSPNGVAVDPDYVWVANQGSNNVTRITKATLATTTITVGSYPYGVAVDGTYCWVANYLGGTVTRILKSDLSTTNIPVGTNPRGVAVDATYCWVSIYIGGTVTRITKSTLATTTIKVGTNPYGVAVDGTYCWVANYSSANVTRILKSDLSTTTIGVLGGTGTWGVAVDETYCWGTANYAPNSIFAINKSTLSLYGTPTGASFRSYGVAVDGTYVWVANYSSAGTVTRITKATYDTTEITVGIAPYSLGDMTGYAYDNYANQ